MWRRAEILHEIGVSWKELSLVCQVSVRVLKAAVAERSDVFWLHRLTALPVPPADRPRRSTLPKRAVWIGQAACSGADLIWFQPSVGKPIDPRARSCCHECTVSQHCLNESLVYIQDHTYRACTTPRIRLNMRKYFYGLTRYTDDDSVDNLDEFLDLTRPETDDEDDAACS